MAAPTTYSGETTSLVPLVDQTESLAVMPVMQNATAIARYEAIRQFVSLVMVNGVDYGVIPGTDGKKNLLKPGAEKLITLFGLTQTFETVDKVQDWTGADHGGEPFFMYWCRCILSRDGRQIAAGEGLCNSWEGKYRWRNAERVCPNCGKAAIRKSSKDGEQGFYCWKKIEGCGATFAPNDKSITGQELGKVPNPDIASLVNTILKMAQKRALVAAALIGVNASNYFTQDMEDLEENRSGSNRPGQPAQQQQQRRPSNSQTNNAAPNDGDYIDTDFRDDPPGVSERAALDSTLRSVPAAYKPLIGAELRREFNVARTFDVLEFAPREMERVRDFVTNAVANYVVEAADGDPFDDEKVASDAPASSAAGGLVDHAEAAKITEELRSKVALNFGYLGDAEKTRLLAEVGKTYKGAKDVATMGRAPLEKLQQLMQAGQPGTMRDAQAQKAEAGAVPA